MLALEWQVEVGLFISFGVFSPTGCIFIVKCMSFIFFRTQWPLFSLSSGSDVMQGLAVPSLELLHCWLEAASLFCPCWFPCVSKDYRHFEDRACLGGPRSLQATVAGHTVGTNVIWSTAGWLGLLDLKGRRLFSSLASPSKQPSAFTFLERQKMLGGQRRRGREWWMQQGSYFHAGFPGPYNACRALESQQPQDRPFRYKWWDEKRLVKGSSQFQLKESNPVTLDTNTLISYA